MAARVINATGNYTTVSVFFNVDTSATQLNRNLSVTGTTYTSANFAVTNNAAIQGIALFLNRATPTSSGVLTVQYQSPPGTVVRTVAVNNTFIPEFPSWCYFHFPTTFNNSGNASVVVLNSTGASFVVYGTTATSNPTRILVNSTVATLAANDTIHVFGRYLNQTGGAPVPTPVSLIANSTVSTPAIAGIEVGSYGSVDYSTAVTHPKIVMTSSAAVPFFGIHVWGNGALRIGTDAARIPVTSIAELNLTSATELSGIPDRGLTIWDGGYFIARGAARAFDRTEVAVSTTSTTATTFIATDTVATTVPLPWTDNLAGTGIADEFLISGGQTVPVTAFEYRRLAVAGSSGSTVNVGAAVGEVVSNLGALKSGDVPYRTKVGLMTRNIKIWSTSATLGFFVNFKEKSYVDLEWAQFHGLSGLAGGSSQAVFGGTIFLVDKRAFTVSTGSFVQTVPISNLFATSAFRLDRCAVGKSRTFGVYLNNVAGNNNITISNNIIGQVNDIEDIGRSAIIITNTLGSNINISGNLLIGGGDSIVSPCVGITVGDSQITLTNNVIANFTDTGFLFTQAASGGPASISGNIIHHCGAGIKATQAGGAGTVLTISDSTFWHLVNNGISLIAGRLNNVVFTNVSFLGATTASIDVEYGSAATKAEMADVQFISCTFAGLIVAGVSATTTTGIFAKSSSSGAGPMILSTKFINCVIGSTTVPFLNVGNIFALDQPSTIQINLENCKFGFNGSFLTVASQANLIGDSFILSQRDNRINNTYKGYFGYGTVSSDTTAYTGATGTHERLTPTSATFKLKSSPKLVAVASGSSVITNVKVRKSTTPDPIYNGSQPRLVLKRNDAIDGLDAPLQFTLDVALATAVGAAGSFETLSGNTSSAGTPGDNGVFEFYVDCDGTAGWVNLEDWSTS